MFVLLAGQTWIHVLGQLLGLSSDWIMTPMSFGKKPVVFPLKPAATNPLLLFFRFLAPQKGRGERSGPASTRNSPKARRLRSPRVLLRPAPGAVRVRSTGPIGGIGARDARETGPWELWSLTRNTETPGVSFGPFKNGVQDRKWGHGVFI